MKLKSIVCSVLVSLPVLGYCAEIPVSAGFDDRIRTVPYNKANVVEIVAKPGVVTQIVFAKGEEYKAHAMGDSDAWHIGYYENNFFIKPAQPLGTTNLSVITNKRNYVFKINFSDNASSRDDMYQVEFVYPDDENQEDIQKAQQQEVETRLDNAFTKKVFNLDYTMKGNRTIAPINVYDDGTFTYFKFSGNVDLPAIYQVIADGTSNGQEMIVNRTVEGEGNNIIVMHKVNYQWRLRLGREVLDIYNENMNWYGTLNKSGTIAPDVERVAIEETVNE